MVCRSLVMPGATAWLYVPLPKSSIEQWRIVVIVTWYTLFVTSQYDVIFKLANQRFGEVCCVNKLRDRPPWNLLYAPWFCTIQKTAYQNWFRTSLWSCSKGLTDCDVGPFCRPLFCHSNVVKCISCLSYNSEAIMRLDYQILLKCPSLMSLVGSSPGCAMCHCHGHPQGGGQNGHLPPPWKFELRTKISKKTEVRILIPITSFNSCIDSLFAIMTLTLQNSQVHYSGFMQWWICSSFMSARFPAEASCETSKRIVLSLVFIA